MASVKKQKQRLIKSLESRFEKLKKESYLTETQLNRFTKEIENINKKSLKELKTLSKGMNKRNIQQITKQRVNYELKQASKTPVKLSTKQVQELGKEGLIEKTKEYLSIPPKSKRLQATQERISSGKMSTANLKTALYSKRTQDILKAVEKSKQKQASMTDIEYLEEIARRSGIASYIGLVDDAKNDKNVMDNIKKRMEKTDRSDYYDSLLKGADITSYYIDNDEFVNIEDENIPFLELM